MNRRSGQGVRRPTGFVSWASKQKWFLVVGAVSVVVAAAVLTFVLAPDSGRQRPPEGSLTPVPHSLSAVPAAPGRIDLTASFAELQSRLPASAGVAIRAIGTAGDEVMLGEWKSGPAWSTIKVPLAIAKVRQQNSGQVTPEVIAAITESDNAAAESIWAGLGDPVTAGAEVEAVLRAAGDPTVVQTQKVRPEYSAFGQTDWSLVNQAQFLASAACDSSDDPVLDLMGQVVGSQKWGLGSIPGSRIKGGWGPSLDGRYLVRQIAIVPTPAGSTVVAMAVEPHSGQYSDGVANLTELAGWLRSHIDALPSGQCGA